MKITNDTIYLLDVNQSIENRDMKRIIIFCLISLMTIGLVGCGKESSDLTRETVAESIPAETETTPSEEQDRITVSEINYMIVHADGGLTLRDGPSTEHTAIYLINTGTIIPAYEFQDNWVYTEVDGYTGWCSADYLSDYKSLLSFQGKETVAFSEMRAYLGKTVGDIKAEYGENFITEVRGKSGPQPCMIYDSDITPYIFYFRRADGVQGGHDNASDNTDYIQSVACETQGIPILINIEIGDTLEGVEGKLGRTLETLPYCGPGIEKTWTEVYSVVHYNDYNVRMVFDDASKNLIRITITDKNRDYFED